MKLSILLCDSQWKIEQVLHTAPDISFSKGDNLTAFISDAEKLQCSEGLVEQKQTYILLHFLPDNHAIPAIICPFPKYCLVFLIDTAHPDEFEEFSDIFTRCIAWAEENLHMPYHDEYYRIQQMNNQLINSQRALMKSNAQLKQLLHDISVANNTITLLEHDHLTGLYHASGFYRKVRQKLDSDNSPYDIIALDIDRFKLINETFGRHSGDRLLQRLALVITGLDRYEQGIFARASADTFYIFMPEDCHFYEILNDEIAVFFYNYPLPIHTFIKIGVYHIEDFSLPVEQMCDKARLALDTLSPTEHTHIAFYDRTLHEKVLREHQLLDNIEGALLNHEFQAYLQEKNDMLTGEVVGAEALIRWIHPTLGFIPPDQFIPLLEANNLVYSVDKYIWEEACKILHTRQKCGRTPLPISVNVARGDLYQDDLIPFLNGLLDKYELEACSLHLEIIERSYVKDSSQIFQVLSSLRENGFIIEMDDFGTGASSLSMLADIPVDYLKLDRSFLLAGLNNNRHVEVMRCIINLAKTLNIEVIAEGIETQEQADFLCSLGCRYAQGYLYSKPSPADTFLNLP